MLLAAVLPLFAATEFHPAWWQILIAAAIGSGTGQLAVRAARGRPVALWAVGAVAVLVAGGAVVWTASHGPRAAPAIPFELVVKAPSGGRSTLTWDDVHAIQTEVPGIRVAAPYRMHEVLLGTEDSNWKTFAVGTTPQYFEVWSLHAALGRLFDAAEDAKVVVLGDTIVHQLFGANRTPIGAEIRIEQQPYTVIGVLEHRGLAKTGQDLDDIAIVPDRIYVRKLAYDSDFHGTVLISVASRADTPRVEEALRSLLRDRHHLAPGTDDDFEIRVVPGK